jgi:prefoldin subunit 5
MPNNPLDASLDRLESTVSGYLQKHPTGLSGHLDQIDSQLAELNRQVAELAARIQAIEKDRKS